MSVLNARVFAELFYSSSVWVNTTKRKIARVQVVQNFAVHVATRIGKYGHITLSSKQFHGLPVAKLLEITDSAIIFKCIKGLAPPHLS